LILLFCLIGAYSTNGSSFDLVMMVFFGVAGYLIKKFGYEPAPLVLAFVLGPMLEKALRQSLLISQGSPMIFITRPISAIVLGCAFLLLLSNIFPEIKKRFKKYETLKE
jgi:putative tricarboxylic transport membrane protein